VKVKKNARIISKLEPIVFDKEKHKFVSYPKELEKDMKRKNSMILDFPSEQKYTGDYIFYPDFPMKGWTTAFVISYDDTRVKKWTAQYTINNEKKPFVADS